MKKKMLLILSMIFCVGGLTACSCGHNWEDATCTTPKTCILCGEIEGKVLVHNWESPTCTKPRTCSLCGETKDEPLGHRWQEATYLEPETCKLCGTTSGEPLEMYEPLREYMRSCVDGSRDAEAYSKGYNDVAENDGKYDERRYHLDDEYAEGVKDAMEDYGYIYWGTKATDTDYKYTYDEQSNSASGSGGGGFSGGASTGEDLNPSLYEDDKKDSKESGTDKKSDYDALDSYDDGYDDVYYYDGEYDEERYRNDKNYADGVDDAMDDWEDADWGDDW